MCPDTCGSLAESLLLINITQYINPDTVKRELFKISGWKGRCQGSDWQFTLDKIKTASICWFWSTMKNKQWSENATTAGVAKKDSIKTFQMFCDSLSSVGKSIFSRHGNFKI